VSAVEEFKVQGGLGCSCNVRDESAILVHYIGADDERATAHVSVWNSTNKLNPTGPPIIQRDYPIAETGKKQEEEQWILRRFIAEWIEKGKPPGRL